MIGAGLRRLAVLFAVLIALTSVVSLVVGLALGAGSMRSLSLGFVTVGSFLLVMGFFVGSRGPVRLVRRDHGSVVGARMAEPGERIEAINLSVLFVGVGFVLLLAGIALDPRTKLI
jgi:hypothetical protein